MKAKINLGQISGVSRKRIYFLANLERKMIDRLYPLVPRFIETYHLTFSAIISLIAVLIFSFLAKSDLRWLWLVNLAILVHYFTDALDGEVGRRRNTGLIKWGFYVDHFFDFFFIAAILLGYAFIFPENQLVLFTIFVITAGHFADSLLRCIALGEYSTSGHFGIGPTEVTLSVLLLNIGLIFDWVRIEPVMVAASILFFFALANSFCFTQKILWRTEIGKKI